MYKIMFFILLSVRLMSQGIHKPDSLAYIIDLEEYVITAQHSPIHYKKANHKVSIITKKEMEARGAISLDQALITNPAIRIGYDPILGSTIRMRGISSSNVAILIDGVPMIGRLDGNIDLSQVSLQNIERIEIVEGSLSNIYGSNAAGGVINLISKNKFSEEWQIDLNTQIESTGQQQYGISLASKIRKLTWNLHGRYYNYYQYKVDSLRLLEEVILNDSTTILQTKYPFNPKKQMGAGAFIDYSFTDESKLNIKYNYNQENVIDYGVVKRPQYKPYALDNFYKTVRSDVVLNYERHWNTSFLKFISAHNMYNRIYERHRILLNENIVDTSDVTSDTIRFVTLFNKAVYFLKYKDIFKSSVGLSYTYESGEGDRIVDYTVSDSSNVYFSELAAFAELNFKLFKDFHVTLSGRGIYHSIFALEFTPSVQLKYNYNDFVFRLSYAEGYRSPALKELYIEFIDINHYIVGNTKLTPELSNDYQFILDYDAESPLSFAFNAYYTIITDKIDVIQFESGKYHYANIDEYFAYGLQPELKYVFKNKGHLSTSTSFSYWSTNIEEKDAPQVGRVVDVNNTVNLPIGKSKFNFMLNHRHIGKQPIYRYRDGVVETTTIKGYELLDLSIYRIFYKNKLSVTGGVKNLLDIKFVSIQGSRGEDAHSSVGRNAIGVGRSFYVQAKYQF